MVLVLFSLERVVQPRCPDTLQQTFVCVASSTPFSKISKCHCRKLWQTRAFQMQGCKMESSERFLWAINTLVGLNIIATTKGND